MAAPRDDAQGATAAWAQGNVYIKDAFQSLCPGEWCQGLPLEPVFCWHGFAMVAFCRVTLGRPLAVLWHNALSQL